jgi:hypothetical protein
LTEPMAARAAAELGKLLRASDSHSFVWPYLASALAAVCRRLPAPDAAAHINSAVDFIIAARAATKEKDKLTHYPYQAEALGALGGQLDADRASRAAGAIIAILGDDPRVSVGKLDFWRAASFLPNVVERLDAAGVRRIVEDLVLVLRKAGDILIQLEGLRTALVALCRRLDADGAARVADALAAAARDSKTSPMVRTLFPDAFAALANRLTPDQSASLASVLVESLADSLLAAPTEPNLQYTRSYLGQALATACGRPLATGAAHAAEALVAAIRDPKTPLAALKPLAKALAAVSGQLPPGEASSHTKQAVDALDSLWVAKAATPDRAAIVEALAAVWTRLDPADATARAKRAAADLEGMLRDPKAAPNQVIGPARALSAVCDHLDPAERDAHANAAADAVVAALQKPRNNWIVVAELSETLVTLYAPLGRPGAVRTADALLVLLDDPNLQLDESLVVIGKYQDRFALFETAFKKVVTRLDERDLERRLEHYLAAGRLQRTLLDALPESKNRSFRNTWDYLDSAEANGNGTDKLAPTTNR